MSFPTKAPRDLRKGTAGKPIGGYQNQQQQGYGGTGGWGGAYDMSGYDTTGYNNYSMTGYNNFGTGGGAVPDVGYDTSSKDPALVRARIFVGNINTNVVTREDLIRMFMNFGPLLGMTVFKGYAFIQMSNEQQAQAAVAATNGQNMHGQAMDVKLSATQRPAQGNLKRVPPAVVQGVPRLPFKRPSESPVTGGPTGDTLKRMKTAFLEQKAKNTTAIQGESVNVSDLFKHDFQDTMICGNCRKVFTDWTEFRDHRKEPCQLGNPKPEGEPDVLYCFVCKTPFDYAWTLLTHLEAQHHLTVYHLSPDKKPEEVTTA